MPPRTALPVGGSKADDVGAAFHPQHQRIGVGIGNIEHHAVAAVVDVIYFGNASVGVRRGGTPVLLKHIEGIVFAGIVGWAPHLVSTLKVLALKSGEKALNG